MSFGAFLTTDIRETFQGCIARLRMDIESGWGSALYKARGRFERCGRIALLDTPIYEIIGGCLRPVNCLASGLRASLNSGLGDRQNFFLPSGQHTRGQQSLSVSQLCTFQKSSAKGTFGHFTGTPNSAKRIRKYVLLCIAISGQGVYL